MVVKWGKLSKTCLPRISFLGKSSELPHYHMYQKKVT